MSQERPTGKPLPSGRGAVTPEFSAVVDLLDAREASVAEAQDAEPEFDLGVAP